MIALPTYIGVDAGGTKCAAVMFDDDIRLNGRGKSGGVNTNFTTIEDCRANVASCVEQLFSGTHPTEIETLFMTFVGPADEMITEISRRATVKNIVRLGEGQAGLLSGGLLTSGLLAMAGTGSDVFYVDTVNRMTVGGWGSILGDQGSGVWIGQRALQAAVAAHSGWGEDTCLMQYFMEDWCLEKPWDLVPSIYRATAPFRKVASALFVVERAAKAGDAVTLNILQQAGEIMATQADCLIHKAEVPPSHQICVCCGGAWKAHPVMFDAFCASLNVNHPGLPIRKPLFEHVIAGVVQVVIENYPLLSHDKQIALIAREFGDFGIKW